MQSHFEHGSNAVHALLRHDRTPADPEDDYLVAVDPSIGRVVSVATNRNRRGFHPATRHEKAQRVTWCVLTAIFTGITGLLLGLGLHEAMVHAGVYAVAPLETLFGLLFGGAGALVGAAIALGLSFALRKPRASWVGEHGIQRYTRGLFLGPKTELLRWQDARTLTVARTRHYYNGVYTGTSYSYIWRGAHNDVLLRLNGSYNDQMPSTYRDEISFAEAAEASWSNHRIRQIDEQIRVEGSARFVCGSEWIGVGAGFIEVGSRGESERLFSNQVQSARFERGVLTISKVGARQGWFTSDGVFRFPASGLPDLQVFLAVMNERAGVRVN